MPYSLKPNEAEFLEKCNEAAEYALSMDNPLIVHHYDADGIASGSIVIGAFRSAKRKHRFRWVKKLDDNVLEEIKNEEEVIFVDLGGGNERVNELEEVLVIDHHQTKGIKKFQINPLLFGIDGGDDLSAAGTAYCIFKNHIELAVVGAIGDMQYPLRGMNRYLLEQGINMGEIVITQDLCFYGKYSRPLIQFLLYSDEPYIPGISYNEEGTLKLLNELGIGLKDGTNWRAYSDLTKEEKTALVSRLSSILLNSGKADDTKKLIGDIYTFPKREKNEAYEAHGFATLLNACGRHNKAEIGVRACLDQEYDEAIGLLQHHRKKIREGIDYAKANVQDMDPFYFVDGRGVIDEGIIGIICGMVIDPFAKKPIIGISTAADGQVKVSGRATRRQIINGVNIGVAMKEACSQLNGMGGGHRIAGGASIPKNRLNEFLVSIGDNANIRLTS